MDTSKNRLFLATLMIIGMGFLAGVYLSYTEYSAHGQSVADLKKARDLSGRLLAGSAVADVTEPVALKQGNVDSAQKDLEDLKAHIAKLRETVSGKAEAHIDGNPKTSNTELSSQIKQSVDELKKLAADRDVRFLPQASEQPDFGFGRYIHNPGSAPKRDFQKVDQQRLIVEFLFKELVESRPAPTAEYKVPLMLLSLAREPVEVGTLVPEGKPGAGTYVIEGGDTARYETEEFTPSRTFRRYIKDKEGRPVQLVDTVSFRLKFISNTVTLRTFVNRLRNSGKPFAITSVEVAPTSAETLKNFQAPSAVVTPAAPGPAFDLSGLGDNGSKPKAAAVTKEERKLVIAEQPSEFTVQVDYLVVLEPKPDAAEGEPKK
ncbi:MAG: hypothetical protein RLZZ412_1939 [Verrucomicrobiota bacterium]|jgi:hypothetical protein